MGCHTGFLGQFVGILAVVVALLDGLGDCKCSIEGIFNFGDSNSDTGGFWAAFFAEKEPFGMTFFKKPAGRASDGRVIVDFLAEAIGIPYISPYLKSIGADYRHGANFAIAGATALLPNTSLYVTGVSPFSLAIQLNQMKEFHARVLEFKSSGTQVATPMPGEEIFGKALYILYIGQNDFTGNLSALGIAGVKLFLPQVISQIVDTIREIYGMGGKTIWVMNMAPIGCYPAFLVDLPHSSSDLDEYGCMISYNNAVIDYNNMLKMALSQARPALPGASLIYVDTHSVLLDVFRHPTSYELKYGTRACCGEGGGAYNFNPKVFCSNTKVINGTTVAATACSDPYNYVSWDGIHATEAANKLVTLAILNGSLFDPPFSLQSLCDLHPIS